MKSSKEIRKEFVGFFTEHAHQFVPSAPVVPHDDPTLLFINAGMNQFKSIFLGDNPKKLTRAANSQKCMRVSGKHNDLEEVGRDHYHHTFFEMLGNWSFGDYYKKEAIRWSWELLTEVWKLPKNRLFVTVHDSDDEAEALWKSETDIEHYRVMRFGDKSNFWEMGETGPCGPCSEIHFDIEDLATQQATYADPVLGVNGENARYRELWNLVFIQYNREKDRSLAPLPSTHVDTGMGFERICAVIQGVDSNYDSDLFQPIIQELSRLSGLAYDRGVPGTPFRVIADHIRALVFAITDGAFPSNEGRGYVLRRLLRRAYRFGRELGFREPFLYKLIPIVIAEMGGAFPEIAMRRSYLEEVVMSEEQRFGATLEQGIEKFSGMILQAGADGRTELAGKELFALYDTFGFPMDLTRLMAQEKGFSVDETGYEALMQQQKERARDAQKADTGLTPTGWIECTPISGTTYVGYEQQTCDVTICRYKVDESDERGLRYLLVLDKTPFYAESGGQVGDTGVLRSAAGCILTITGTIKWNDLVVHRAESAKPLIKSELLGIFTAEVHGESHHATRRNHSATHLLQAALIQILGSHVQQSGSKVEPTGLRFDFTHFRALTTSEIRQVEELVNGWILDDLPVSTEVKELAAAKESGATALFGEKYGDTVRVVAMGSVSSELCGGTHVTTTGSIGLIHIVAETSISAGIRRIEAVTGLGVAALVQQKEETVSALTHLLKIGEGKLVTRVEGLIEQIRQLEEQVKRLSIAQAAAAIGEVFTEAHAQKGTFPWVVKSLRSVDKESFARSCDVVSDGIKANSYTTMVVVLAAVVEGNVLFAASAGKEALKSNQVHCGDLVKIAAQIAGGSGGGSPVRAQAGGKDPNKMEAALKAVTVVLTKKAGA